MSLRVKDPQPAMRCRRPVDSLGVIGLVALMVGGCGTAAMPGLSAGPTATFAPSTPAATTRPSPTSRPEAILATFDVGGDGWSMTKAGGALWIQVDPMVNAIVRVDTTTGETLATARGGHKVKAGDEGLWVLGGGWVARLDPATGAENLRLPLGGAFALGDGAVWILNADGLHRIDAVTGVAAEPIKSDAAAECSAPKDLVVAFKSAWVACKEGKVVRIALNSGETTQIRTQAGAHTFAVTDDSIWVTNYEAETVSRIDPLTDEVTTVAGAGSGVGITVGDGFIWASGPTGIVKIDPESRSILGSVYLGRGEYYELVWDAGVIWASTRGAKILKIDPTKLEP